MYDHSLPHSSSSYSASDIEVLEGLEPVRLRPGMYIGGTDIQAMHHLVSEVLDNAMDEAVAGHASQIWVTLGSDGSISVRDNGRGIPVDPHPKFPDKSALEVILTTLHSGGKFKEGAYATAGGLHGVGVSVVNALSKQLVVEVARDGLLYTQMFEQGIPVSSLTTTEAQKGFLKGTRIRFWSDPEIFGGLKFEAQRVFTLIKSKAFLHKGVKIHWDGPPGGPEKQTLWFPKGLEDFVTQTYGEAPYPIFAGQAPLPEERGLLEWAFRWGCDHLPEDGIFLSFCNTIPTPLGGTHEQGARNALLRALRAYADRVGQKKASGLHAEDILASCAGVISLFLKGPHFQGQTKEKLVSPEANRLTEGLLKDHLDHFLSANPEVAQVILDLALETMQERLNRRSQKEMSRKSATKKLRLPGKLTDCSKLDRVGTELFLVEGDSAGGSAKQARDRTIQAILPLRGKILNVASSSSDKAQANRELNDLILAIGCGIGKACDPEARRYDRVIIMTDADVDGAHIASLLMTFFCQKMSPLVEGGHVYLAQPPLYRLQSGGKTYYAQNDVRREELLTKQLKDKRVEISRFKGLGEMSAVQLKETTMDPKTRTLLKLDMAEPLEEIAQFIDDLMGRSPEKRFRFISQNADLVREELDF